MGVGSQGAVVGSFHANKFCRMVSHKLTVGPRPDLGVELEVLKTRYGKVRRRDHAATLFKRTQSPMSFASSVAKSSCVAPAGTTQRM